MELNESLVGMLKLSLCDMLSEIIAASNPSLTVRELARQTLAGIQRGSPDEIPTPTC
jgi:hypothetical protein